MVQHEAEGSLRTLELTGQRAAGQVEADALAAGAALIRSTPARRAATTMMRPWRRSMTARRARHDELMRAARSTQHKPLKGVKRDAQKRERLRNMKVLILDNSQRRLSVASASGVTRSRTSSKLTVSCEAWASARRRRRADRRAGTVDDLFCQQLGDAPYTSWTFSRVH